MSMTHSTREIFDKLEANQAEMKKAIAEIWANMSELSK